MTFRPENLQPSGASPETKNTTDFSLGGASQPLQQFQEEHPRSNRLECDITQLRAQIQTLGARDELSRLREQKTIEASIEWTVYTVTQMTPTAFQSHCESNTISLVNTRFVDVRLSPIGGALTLDPRSNSIEVGSGPTGRRHAEEEVDTILRTALLDSGLHPVSVSYADLPGTLIRLGRTTGLHPDTQADGLKPSISLTAALTLSPYHGLQAALDSEASPSQTAVSRADLPNSIERYIRRSEYHTRLMLIRVLALLEPNLLGHSQHDILQNTHVDQEELLELCTTVDEAGLTNDTFLRALEIVNVVEEFQHSQLQELTQSNPSLINLRLLAILPPFGQLPVHVLDALLPQAAALIRQFNRLEEEHQPSLPFAEEGLARRTIDQLWSTGLFDSDEQFARSILYREFGIDPSAFETISRYYHDFIGELSATIGGEMVRNPIVQNLRSQDNDIDMATAVELLQCATWQGQAIERYRDCPNPERIQFEARRKIYMMGEIVKAIESYNRALQRGRGPLAYILKQLIGPARDVVFGTCRNSQQEILKVQVFDGDRAPAPHPKGEWQYHITRLRTLRLVDGTTVDIQHDPRIKELESFIRKWFLGNRDARDMFGSAIAFCLPHTHPLLHRQTRPVVTGPRTFDASSEFPTEEVTDHAIVFELIDAIRAFVAKEYGSGWDCWVSHYTPTPSGPNQSLPGNTAGSDGNDLRLAKLTVHLRGRDADERWKTFTEELQLFTDDPRGTSLYYWARKKEDDSDYKRRRLVRPLQVMPHLSPAELHFPVDRYGPINPR